MIKIAIVEDEAMYAKQLEEFLHQYEKENGEAFDITIYSDGDQIVNKYQSQYDIILMDVEMKFMDGMSAAEEIRKVDTEVVIIFITNMAQYAIRGYAVDALDYVLKPVSYFAFSQRLSRAIGRMKKRETKMIMVSMKGGTVRINIANIYYIESQGHTLILHTILGDYETTGTMKEMEEKLDDSVCAVMLELIQGEGGVLPLDQEFVKETEKICREKDILLLIDEVQTGIGRTGTLFCYEQYGISPDVVSAAKGLGGGLPIGAVIASEKCGDVLGAGTHGTTFGGNPLCCAAADTVLSIINTPQFLNSVKEKGRYLKQAILNLGSKQIKEVRGMGLILGIAVEPEKRAGLTAALMEKGVLVLTAGEDTIRLLPPLVITKEEIDRAVEAMKEVF